MRPENRRQIEEICEAALNLPIEQRGDFLARACKDDVSLREDVEKRLASYAPTADSYVGTGEARAGLLAGRHISHYKIRFLLGAGGMGEVYQAYDEQLQRDVAIKVLSGAGVGDVSARARLLREARSAAALNHPNVCTIYEVSESDGQAYIAMELIDGHSLNRLIPVGGLPIEDVIRYGLQIVDAVAHAHERGVIHRDLKTINTLVTKQHLIKVLDFGLAKRTSGDDISSGTAQSTVVTGVNTLVGTLPYMAPEQFRGQPADIRSDVWSLGIVLYEMISGERPFHGQTAFELSSAILSQPTPPMPAKVPAGLRSVIERCLKKHPQERYANGAEVRDALAQIQTVENIQTAPIATPRQTQARAFRLPYWIPIGVLALSAAWFIVARFGREASSITKETPRTIRPLTSYVGWELAPSWSPDGSQVVYSQVGRSADVAVISRGGEPHLLTTNPADEFNPRWSPKGDKIVFLSDRGTGTNIYWIPASGGAEHKIAETHIPFLQRMAAWAGALGANPWSPDENEIVFSRLQPSGEVALWKFALDAGTETKLTAPPPGAEDIDAAWSFDGKSIAFTRSNKGLSAVWQVSPRGGGESVFLEEGSSGPAWTPDNKRIVFQSFKSGAFNIWEIELSTRKQHQLTFGPGLDIEPVVARDGSIAYGQYGHDVQVYEARVDSPNEEHRQLTMFTGENFSPRVSADGTVLYTTTRSGDNEIWALDPKTGTHKNLTNNPASDRLADWSPDGKEIVFMSDRGGAVKLWVMLVDNGAVRQLTDQELPWAGHTAEAEGGPRWSPDGKLIAYLAPQGTDMAIWVVDRDGKNPHATPIRGVTSFSWYKDSGRLVYTRPAPDSSGKTELRAAHLATGEDQLLRTGRFAEVAVAADGGALSFIDAVSHFTMALYTLRLARTQPNELPRIQGEPQLIASGEGKWHAHAGGWSPDGRNVVYSRDRDFGDIYVLEPGK